MASAPVGAGVFQNKVSLHMNFMEKSFRFSQKSPGELQQSSTKNHSKKLEHREK